MSEICETGITWDHDTGDIWVSTRRPAVATKLRKCGLKAEKGGNGYYNFQATEDDLIIGFRKKKRLSEKRRREVADRLMAGRNANK